MIQPAMDKFSRVWPRHRKLPANMADTTKKDAKEEKKDEKKAKDEAKDQDLVGNICHIFVL